jgi:hypothetical protein
MKTTMIMMTTTTRIMKVRRSMPREVTVSLIILQVAPRA